MRLDSGSNMTAGRVALPVRQIACAALGVWACLALCPANGWAQDEVFSQEEICQRKFQEGLQYKGNQQLATAAERFTEVKEACPDRIDAYLNLGEIQVRMDDYLEAIDTYRDALDQDPGNLDVQEHLAFALSAGGEFEDALELYLELNEKRPNRPQILKNLAFVYQQMGRVAEAIMLYNKLVEMDQADARTVSEAGRLALDNSLYLPAVTFYKKLYEFDPTNVNTLHVLAGYYFQIRFYEEAAFYYDKLLEQELSESQRVSYHKYRGYCRNKARDYVGAAEDYEFLIEQEPEDASHYCNLVFAYKDGGKLEEALAAVQRGIEAHPTTGCLYYGWAVTVAAQGDNLVRKKDFSTGIAKYRAAKEHFQKVIDLQDPHYANTAGDQLGRMDALVARAQKLAEKESLGG